MQEMLTFLIQLVKERRFCGLSTSDNLKRELIYKLAVVDSTHSQIVKSLPRALSSSDQLQNVLDSLAVYSNPSGMKQGKYVLRKTFWKELDLYHPRWNSRELQIAEERYYRFCKVSALNAQLPQWTHVFRPLHNISKIATSKAVLQIVRAVLFYAVYSDPLSVSRAPDNVLVTGLHLLWLALDICESESKRYANQYGMDIVQHDDESWVVLSSYAEEAFPILTYSTELVPPVSGKVKNESMLTLLVSLMHLPPPQTLAAAAGVLERNISIHGGQGRGSGHRHRPWHDLLVRGRLAARPRGDHRQRPGQPHHPLLRRLHRLREAHRRCCQEPGRHEPHQHRLW
jgi:hypothetical protein